MKKIKYFLNNLHSEIKLYFQENFSVLEIALFFTIFLFFLVLFYF